MVERCDSERHSERLARLEEFRHLVNERFVSRDKALDVATAHQREVDEKLNDVRTRFVDKEGYKDDRQRLENAISSVRIESEKRGNTNTSWLVGLLGTVIILLLAVVADIATRIQGG